MLRLLIADGDEIFVGAVCKQLKNGYLIRTCHDGGETLGLIESFEPDIILLDTMLPVVDSICVLRSLRASGRTSKVLALSRSITDYALSQMQELGVSCVIPKPCTVGAVVSHIHSMGFQLEHPGLGGWCVENEIDNILLSLGFRLGPSRYFCTVQAILIKYQNLNAEMMKVVYPTVAKGCSGNVLQVEKAIRDAIKDAYKNGDKRLWRMYFLPRRGNAPYPSNDEFISRIADCLIHKTRIKKPCDEYRQQA